MRVSEWKLLSCVRLFAMLWTVASQAPLSMKFSKQEYWRGLPFPSPGDLPHLRIKLGSPALQADSLLSESSLHVAQLYPTLCNPMNCSLPGSSVHGIFQARILAWVANSFSRGSSLHTVRTRVSCIAGRFFTVWATRKAQTPGTGNTKPNKPYLQGVSSEQWL